MIDQKTDAKKLWKKWENIFVYLPLPALYSEKKTGTNGFQLMKVDKRLDNWKSLYDTLFGLRTCCSNSTNYWN